MRLGQLGVAGEADDGVLAVRDFGIALVAFDWFRLLRGSGIGLPCVCLLYGHVTPFVVRDVVISNQVRA
jgi:hypothetical protein